MHNVLAQSDHMFTFRGTMNRLPFIVPLGLDVNVIILAVRWMGGGVGGAVFIHWQLTVWVRVCWQQGGKGRKDIPFLTNYAGFDLIMWQNDKPTSSLGAIPVEQRSVQICVSFSCGWRDHGLLNRLFSRGIKAGTKRQKWWKPGNVEEEFERDRQKLIQAQICGLRRLMFNSKRSC